VYAGPQEEKWGWPPEVKGVYAGQEEKWGWPPEVKGVYAGPQGGCMLVPKGGVGAGPQSKVSKEVSKEGRVE
jgi:hypothetical protein